MDCAAVWSQKALDGEVDYASLEIQSVLRDELKALRREQKQVIEARNDLQAAYGSTGKRRAKALLKAVDVRVQRRPAPEGLDRRHHARHAVLPPQHRPEAAPNRLVGAPRQEFEQPPPGRGRSQIRPEGLAPGPGAPSPPLTRAPA